MNRRSILALIIFFHWIFLPALSYSKYISIPLEANRTWLGPDLWANRLQDWKMVDGHIECTKYSNRFEMRTAHFTTHRIKEGNGQFQISMQISPVDQISTNSKAGVLIGAAPTVDYRAASLVHHAMGPGAGYFVGIDGGGNLLIEDMNGGTNFIRTLISKNVMPVIATSVNISIVGQANGDEFTIFLQLQKNSNDLQQVVFKGSGAKSITGNIALVSHPGDGGRFWFNNINITGDKVDYNPIREIGPILSAQHTLSHNILKLTAQFMPIGENENQEVLLQIKQNDIWETIARTNIITPGYVANFRVEDWDSTKDTPYRVAYIYRENYDLSVEKVYEGTIRRDPVDKETIVVAGFTGNHNTHRGIESKYFNWNENGLWFPHNDVVRNVAFHKPDVLFFSGDQVYEGASPTHPDHNEPYLDLLYKWYLWCWAFRDLTRDTPTITIPDDHDVYQGNLWGAGGRATDKDDKGGYVMPAEWVEMAERIQVSNLPDPYDPTPIEQEIGVYYTNMNYGRISFAILEDRKFKSGCDGLIPGKTGRADHVDDPAFDVTLLDQPQLKLLGDRQHKFLDEWGQDWAGVDFKVALSQTVFANAATLHGAELERLHADLDSNGWPQSGRKRALEAFRKCFAFMYGGDQHLATIIHHGIDTWNDAGWSFTVPSIANFYPRAWVPLDEPNKPIPNGMEYTGEYKDGLGNFITVYAHTNPGKDMRHEPKELHNNMPGYGIIRLNKTTRDITMENWSRFADPSHEDAKQYEGWPLTINQLDNYGKEAVAYLPELVVSGMDNPVVQVIEEDNNEVVYTLRINGSTFRPKVFTEGKYTVKVGELGTDSVKSFNGLETIAESDKKKVDVVF